MANQHDPIRCEELLALLANVSEAESEHALQEIAAHIEHCPECRLSEERLSGLLGAYTHSEPPPITDDLEQRLLLHLCGPR